MVPVNFLKRLRIEEFFLAVTHYHNSFSFLFFTIKSSVPDPRNFDMVQNLPDPDNVVFISQVSYVTTMTYFDFFLKL
jgi:hypothetical protein